MYANGEKWAQVQAKGFMRDRKGKIMTPLISIRRGSITERDTLKKLDVNQNPSGNAQVLQNKFEVLLILNSFNIFFGFELDFLKCPFKDLLTFDSFISEKPICIASYPSLSTFFI